LTITGVNHITLSVSDLDRSLAFYSHMLGFTIAAHSSRGAYLRAGSLWPALEVDDQVRTGPLPEYTHVALDVAAKDFDGLAARIRASGAGIFKENVSEGPSLYFLDPDGHKLELHVGDLETRLSGSFASPAERLRSFICRPRGCVSG
jgi:catechol 2,3-dioxygenase-like lactoylglutathione lyase family enzyme